VQWHREYPRVRKAGAELVLIGNGSRHFARAFRDERGITALVYVDTERRAYEALGMKRGVLTAVGSVAAVRNAARAWRAGFRQGPVQGDAWQLGAVLVVRKGGEVAYRHLSAEAGDHPPVADVLAALETA
jgi:hypothetical protein